MKILRLLVVVCSLFVAANLSLAPVTFAAKTPAETGQSVAAKIDLNTADAATLVTLPGIGEKTAEAIIDYRKTNGNFTSIDELTAIKGIGEKKLAKIRPFLKAL